MRGGSVIVCSLPACRYDTKSGTEPTLESSSAPKSTRLGNSEGVATLLQIHIVDTFERSKAALAAAPGQGK